MIRECGNCGERRPHRALGLCDPCYQRHLYWSDVEKHRAAGRKSVQLTRLKRRGLPVKAALKMIELMEAQRDHSAE